MFKTSKHQRFLLVLISVILTAVIGIICVYIEKDYLSRNPYFYDSASYMEQSVRLYENYRLHGSYPQFVCDILTSNPVLRNLPFIFAPSLLENQFAHLWTALPMFACFLFFCGLLVVKKTNNMFFAVSAIACFSCFYLLFDPNTGLGAYWLDLPASFLLASSAICIYIYNNEGRMRWLILFSCLFALSILSRYIMVVYGSLLLAPLLFFGFIKKWHSSREFLKSIVYPGLIVLSIILVLAGPFVFLHFEKMLFYYSKMGYSLSHPWKDCAYNFWFFLRDNVTIAYIILYLSMPLGSILLSNERKFLKFDDSVACFFLVGALPIFWVFVINSYNYPCQYLVWVPFLFVSCLFLVRSFETSRFSMFFSLALCTISLSVSTYVVFDKIANAKKPVSEQKIINSTIALFLKEANARKWAVYFDERKQLVNMAAYYEQGFFSIGDLLLDVPTLFSIHQAYFQAHFPSMSAQEVADTVAKNALSMLDAAVVFDNPSMVDSIKFNNPYSRSVAKAVSLAFATSPDWENISVLETKSYYRLAFYVRKSKKQKLQKI